MTRLRVVRTRRVGQLEAIAEAEAVIEPGVDSLDLNTIAAQLSALCDPPGGEAVSVSDEPPHALGDRPLSLGSIVLGPVDAEQIRETLRDADVLLEGLLYGIERDRGFEGVIRRSSPTLPEVATGLRSRISRARELLS